MSAGQHVHELFTAEQHTLYMLLFNLIIRHDDRLRLDVADAIRRILQNQTQTHPVPANVQQQLRALRDDLLKPSPPEAVEVMSAHPVRLVT